MNDTDLPEYHRICPSCGAANAPAVLRCACGAMLAGVDLMRVSAPAVVVLDAEPAEAAPATLLCPHEDCAQPNPPRAENCVYCDRPLHALVAHPLTDDDAPASLIHLPAPLAERYRIVRPFPVRGAEAEILLVEPLAGGTPVVAKLYRNGILPKAEIQARLKQIDPHSCVQVLASGVSDGHAFEVMEYCAFGSLRDYMPGEAMTPALLQAVIGELAQALAATHAVGIVHRDLKPENVLLRSRTPLDLVLTDFSIASVLEATQCFTGMARTLMYAAPESLSGVIDAKADYWALGMMLLEAALGRHPFAGLSDTVVLHHLSTRSVDLGALADANLRKLLRGLLLRDPKQRWGAAELKRWLANDSALVEPQEHGTAGNATAYRIGKDVCHSPEQLAVALARNWQAGISDIHNGQLQSWFRDVQKDQNTVRLLIEVKHEKPLSPDMQLLRLILHLAPGIPPVWRGESVELRAILTHASLALKGDAAAAHWLVEIYQTQVLDAYASAGNAELADLARGWHEACDQFAERWKARLGWLRDHAQTHGAQAQRPFEELMFGTGGPQQPSLSLLLPRMLALIYDHSWEARLRQYLTHEFATLSASSPWLAELDDPLQSERSELLVLEALLPDARKTAARIQEAEQRKREGEAADLRALSDEAAANLNHLRNHSHHHLLNEEVAETLTADLIEFQRILQRLRSQGSSDAGWQALRKRYARIEPIAKRVQQQLDQFSESQARRSGWFSREMASFVALAAIFLLPFLGRRFFFVLLALSIVVALAYFGAPLLRMRRLRELLDQI